MISIEERIKRADARVSYQEHKKRILQRQEHERQKKAIHGQNYIIGEAVLKVSPQLIELKSLDQFLSMIASNPRLMEQLKKLSMKVNNENDVE